MILLSTGFLYVTSSLESHKATKSSSLISASTRKSPEPLRNESVTYVERGELYGDFLLPRDSKTYAIEAPEGTLVSFFFQTDSEAVELDLEAKGSINRTKFDVVWLPPPYVYYVYNRSEIRFLITNRQADTVSYRFYVDISEPLGDSSSKILHLEGGKAAFHIDLRKDDRVLLKLGSANYSKMRIWVFILYREVLPETIYKLRSYRQSLYGTLYFTADLGGRYYIVIDSVEGEGKFFLTSSTYSPPWNQEWFWPAVLFAFFITAISLTDIERIRKLEKAELSSLISYYSWFVTIGLYISLVGSFGYGTLVQVPLFYLLIFFYGLSHVLQIYASHLDRKIASQNCPNCGRKVNLQEVNYCCGRIVKNISDAWFLLPLSFGLLFFIMSYVVFNTICPTFLGNSLWLGSCGSIIGGIIAWWINRKVYAVRSWKENPSQYYIPSHIPFVSIGLLVTGIVFSFLSPLLVGILLEAFLKQHVESFLPAHAPWVRIRIAPLTLSLYVILGSAISAILSGLFVAYQIRKIFTKGVPEEKNRSDLRGLDEQTRRSV